jgi:predicted metal-binding membrane protein
MSHLASVHASRHAFFGVSALLFAASATVTIAWCAAMSAMGGMPMPGGWTMTMTWMRMPGQTWPGAAASFLGMWVAMMAAMMLPSSWPMIRTFGAVSARNRESGRTRAFVGAYLAVWIAFSTVATAAQWVLQRADWVNPMIVSTSASLTAAMLVVAGVYQFSPLKRVCLSRCRTPLGFLLGEWRPGSAGAWTMGLRHGLLCVGCCWALMALLFVGGAMNLPWVAALAIVVAIEKMAPMGDRVAFALGVLLMAAGGAKLALLLH